ncbi:MAG: hypothetical protein IKG59_03300 [Firmicutes bacterium]|nr:hypothetical protein [Bacillota bacterium]
MSSMRILRPLPDAPTPTKPKYINDVRGVKPEHLEVRHPKPAPILRASSKAQVVKKAKQRTAEMQARKAEAVELFRQGLGNSQIAEKMGLARSTVSCYTHEIRMQMLTETSIDAEVTRLYREGLSYDDIADRLNVSRSYIGSRISIMHKEHRLERRRAKCERTR